MQRAQQDMEAKAQRLAENRQRMAVEREQRVRVACPPSVARCFVGCRSHLRVQAARSSDAGRLCSRSPPSKPVFVSCVAVGGQGRAVEARGAACRGALACCIPAHVC